MLKCIFRVALLSGAVFGSLLAGTAVAQVSFGNDRPINVQAERATYRGAITVLSGDVRVKQGDATIFSDRMNLHRNEITTSNTDTNANSIKLGNINRIVAVGNFKYSTLENSVTGDKGVYERDKEIITVTGNARFVQNNGNTVTGNKMIYDLNTNRAKIDGNCTGRDCKNNDRVKINIGGKN